MLETILPQNELLKKHIRYIYRFSTDDPAFDRRLIIFPNVGSAISLYKDVVFIAENDQHFLSLEKQGNCGVVLHLNRIDPISIRDQGRQKRIGIVFYPLALNNFIRVHVGDLPKDNNPSFIPVADHFGDLLQLCREMKFEESLQSIAERIEDSLLKLFIRFDEPILDKAIDEIDQADHLTKIDDISRRIGTSAKTLKRLFHKHIGLSPVEYRKIVQFRSALRAKLDNPDATYTSIAWENSYYDLPYMMKVFKDMTGASLKDFFNRVSYTDDRQYVYIG